MSNTVGQLEGGLENMGPTLTGIVRLRGVGGDIRGLGDIHSDNSRRSLWYSGLGDIITDEGDKYFFTFKMCKDTDTFGELKDGMRVTFKKTTHTLKGEVATELVAHDVAIDTSEETTTLTKQTEDTVAWIMKWGAEEVDEVPKMREKLERLEGTLEKAMEAHKTMYWTDMNNIRQVVETITYSTTEWLDYETIDLQTIFTVLQGVKLSDEDKKLFGNLYFQFMEESPEIQAHILWLLELVSTYAFAKNSDLTIHTNPLKNILFSENNISYNDWIIWIFEGFKRDEAWMISLSKSIWNAEAPQIGFKQFIRHLFDTKPEVLDEEDRAWLKALYIQWPDEEVTNKQGTLTSEEKKERDRIAKKYVFKHSEMGKTSINEQQDAEIFKHLIVNK